ncbi:Precorrin-8X methylmutase CbiC/CobH [Thermosinus carboxydivorans Nor1]|uniref:Precorrin-8X methylmutase CbiC/CobH n=1 Tax=Thermosinus carboxydivorans Nor1 TaxID=401526 RepID=A1HPW9_9FIRM|nr:Precorrin-8X methylmutase CbiC/CobH [Thermosinus carboxydivorans Nor1]
MIEFLTDPIAIESRSMDIIAPYLRDLNLSPQEIKLFSRIIHAAGDPDYARIIRIHPEAIHAGCTALKAGCHIFTDVEMVRTGINKRKLAEYGGEAHCLVADNEIARLAKTQGITRAMAAIRAFGQRLNGAIVAIGNAPTALFEIFRLMEQQEIRPALIIGVPVGFVGAAEAKELLIAKSPVPYITVIGNKGGSPIAAAAVNALLYMLDA